MVDPLYNATPPWDRQLNKEEQRAKERKEREREAADTRLEYLLKQSDCRKCGAENNEPNEYCEECQNE